MFLFILGSSVRCSPPDCSWSILDPLLVQSTPTETLQPQGPEPLHRWHGKGDWSHCQFSCPRRSRCSLSFPARGGWLAKQSLLLDTRSASGRKELEEGVGRQLPPGHSHTMGCCCYIHFQHVMRFLQTFFFKQILHIITIGEYLLNVRRIMVATLFGGILWVWIKYKEIWKKMAW